MTGQTPGQAGEVPETFARWLSTRMVNTQTGYRWEHLTEAERKFWRELDRLPEKLDAAEQEAIDARSVMTETFALIAVLADGKRPAQRKANELRKRAGLLPGAVGDTGDDVYPDAEPELVTVRIAPCDVPGHGEDIQWHSAGRWLCGQMVANVLGSQGILADRPEMPGDSPTWEQLAESLRRERDSLFAETEKLRAQLRDIAAGKPLAKAQPAPGPRTARALYDPDDGPAPGGSR